MDLMREQWLSHSIQTSLRDAYARRSSGNFQRSEIRNQGELRLLGLDKKLFQVVRFRTFEGVIKATLSDRFNTIACHFSETCKVWFESTYSRRLTTCKGTLIQLTSYDFVFSGTDCALFWNGVSFQDQFLREHRAREARTIKEDPKGKRPSIESRWGDIPVPQIHIHSFKLINENSEIWGNPKAVTSISDIISMMVKLPRQERRGKEVSVSEQESPGGIQVDKPESSGRGKSRTAKQTLEKKLEDNGISLRSQNSDAEDEGLSQEKFITQVPRTFGSHPSSLSPARSNISSSSVPDFAQRERMTSSQTAAAARKAAMERNLRIIVYNDSKLDAIQGPAYTDCERQQSLSDTRNAGARGNSGKTLPSRGRDPYNKKPIVPSTSNAAMAKGKHQPPMHSGWQGMAEVSLEEAKIPKDQLAILESPDSWWPPGNSRPISGYDQIPKVQLIPKAHPPRPVAPQLAIETNVEKPPVPESSAELSWSPSPEPDAPQVRSKDFNAMPPDSSSSNTQDQPAGRWSAKANLTSESASSPPKKKHAPEGLPPKRVTRADNGISKKITPVVTEQVASPKRHSARIVKKSPVPKHKSGSKSANSYIGSDSDTVSPPPTASKSERVPPFPIANPDGRTEIEKYGGILSAQRVGMWRKKQRHSPDPEPEEEEEGSCDEPDIPEPNEGSAEKIHEAVGTSPCRESISDDKACKNLTNLNDVGAETKNSPTTPKIITQMSNSPPPADSDEDDIPQAPLVPFKGNVVVQVKETPRRSGGASVISPTGLSTQDEFSNEIVPGIALSIIAATPPKRDDKDHGHLNTNGPEGQQAQAPEVEVPATAVELPPKKAKRFMKNIEFGTQEIRAVSGHDFSRMLEEQKRQFMNCDNPPFKYATQLFHSRAEGLIESEQPDSMQKGNEPQQQVSQIQKVETSAEVIQIDSTPECSAESYISIKSEFLEQVFPDRKRRRTPPTPTRPLKVLKGDGLDGFDNNLSDQLRQSFSPPEGDVLVTNTLPLPPSSPVPKLERSENEEDPLPFSPWKKRVSARVEMYAGIRPRQINVPGYENFTDDQRKQLDERRKKYFGGSVGCFHSRSPLGALGNGSGGVPENKVKKESKEPEDVWYLSEDTPMKVFLRKFSTLPQVKADLAANTVPATSESE